MEGGGVLFEVSVDDDACIIISIQCIFKHLPPTTAIHVKDKPCNQSGKLLISLNTKNTKSPQTLKNLKT